MRSFCLCMPASRRIQKENVVVKFEEFLRTERVVAQYGNVR